MEHLLNFFEDLDEMVYISDTETDRACVYEPASARYALGFENHAQYQGQMCYKVLRGYDQPCSFCTNHILEPNSFPLLDAYQSGNEQALSYKGQCILLRRQKVSH